ncbi:MAG: hypothetical protein ACOCUL_05165 [Bacteroidota bacterium]
MKKTNFLIISLMMMLMVSCYSDKYKKIADNHFGDQHFKTAVAIIELHKIRYGEYPENLDSLKYLGDWDKDIKRSVKYKKVKDGYHLDLLKGIVSNPANIEYPADFWNNLGVKKSNIKR